jgi:vacuolar-type H+-ATPase subunit E/Vma4
MITVKEAAARERDRKQKAVMENLKALISEVLVEARDGELSRITPRTRSALDDARAELQEDIETIVRAWSE